MTVKKQIQKQAINGIFISPFFSQCCGHFKAQVSLYQMPPVGGTLLMYIGIG